MRPARVIRVYSQVLHAARPWLKVRLQIDRIVSGAQLETETTCCGWRDVLERHGEGKRLTFVLDACNAAVFARNVAARRVRHCGPSAVPLVAR